MDLITLALAIKKAKNYTDAAALVGVPVNYPEVDAVTGTWKVFDPVTDAYIDTGIVAHGTDGQDGAPGPNEVSKATVERNRWCIDIGNRYDHQALY